MNKDIEAIFLDVGNTLRLVVQDEAFQKQIAEVKAAGAEVYFLPKDERAKWKKATLPFWNDLEMKYPEEYPKLMVIVNKLDSQE